MFSTTFISFIALFVFSPFWLPAEMPLVPDIAFKSLHQIQTNAETATDDSELFPSEDISEFVKGLPEQFTFRSLRLDDYNKGFLNVLEDLTVVGNVTEEEFRARFKSMSLTNPLAYFIIVAEDKSSKKIVASITLVLEWKFIHNAGARGRIEDVVVHHDYRSKGLARHLNEIAVGLAKKKGVYKLSLECRDELLPFYEKFGYNKDQNFLVQRFDQ